MIRPVIADVSRETMDRLECFVGLLLKWNPAINLISRSTEQDVWGRHIQDSLQLLQIAPVKPRIWMDLGSGGGLPGIVVAAVLAETVPDCAVHLVEADSRKATFLREASRQLSISTVVHGERIEKLAPLTADVVSARALASLPTLFDLSYSHLAPGGISLFLKGESWPDEVKDAQKEWNFAFTPHKSLTAKGSAIIEVRELTHV